MRAIDKAVDRASTDAGFRVQLMEDPKKALDGHELTDQERRDLLAEVRRAGVADNTTGTIVKTPPPGQPKW